MTQRTTPPARSRRTAALTAADLRVTVPLLTDPVGETTFSFLHRTAAANGLDTFRLLRVLHADRSGRPGAGAVPGLHEARLTPAALEKLTSLTGRTAEELNRALPATRPPHLLDGPTAAVRLTAWPDTPGGAPLPACQLCQEPVAWLVPDSRRWGPCPCARRWATGDDRGHLLDTTPLPDLARARQRHQALVDRIGPAGEALVADAHQVALWWWTARQVGHDTWRTREEVLGQARHRRPSTPRRSLSPS
ncbi:hypothetical protein ACFVZ3_43515 [Kitasatospora purpeofusca]|uniref:hypothetical protein n=1 Tax=Kitasatospora purpeofusca TaxID=67352 RepID=UPI0036AB1387